MTTSCPLQTPESHGDDLDTYTVSAYTTAVRGSRWENPVPKPYPDEETAFNVQRIATFASVKLDRKLGGRTRTELE